MPFVSEALSSMAEAPSTPTEAVAAAVAAPKTPGASSTYCVSFKETHSDVAVKAPVLTPRDESRKLSFTNSHDGAVVGEDSRNYGQKVRLLEEEPEAILPAEG